MHILHIAESIIINLVKHNFCVKIKLEHENLYFLKIIFHDSFCKEIFNIEII